MRGGHVCMHAAAAGHGCIPPAGAGHAGPPPPQGPLGRRCPARWLNSLLYAVSILVLAVPLAALIHASAVQAAEALEYAEDEEEGSGGGEDGLGASVSRAGHVRYGRLPAKLQGLLATPLDGWAPACVRPL